MKIQIWLIIALVSLCIILIGLPACNTTVKNTPTTTPFPTATTMASGHGFIPGNVLASLPLYPGAIPTTFSELGSVSVPFDQPIYNGALKPGYQSAYAQYSVNAPYKDIMSWYVNELSSKGYRRKSVETSFSGESVDGRGISFFLPSQPLVNVYIYIYYLLGEEETLELLVTYSVPLPKPPEEQLPDDIDSITVTYYSGNLTTVKTITDSQTVTILVSMVNALPMRPDYTYSCPSGLVTKTIFSLVFHSQSKGDITVRDVIGCGEWGIHIGDYPILEDTQGLLKETVEQILGIPNP